MSHEETLIRLAWADHNVRDAALDYAIAITHAEDLLDLQTIGDALKENIHALLQQEEAMIRKREQLQREAAERTTI